MGFRLRVLGAAVLALLALGGCSTAGKDDIVVPTLASLDTLPTAIFLTENAPPPGFSTVQFDPIDRNLSVRPGWVYTISGSFEGTADDTGDPVTGTLAVEVLANELGQTRRVVLAVEGSAFLPSDALLELEGVRFSNDYYIVDVNGQCSEDTGQNTGGAEIADLAAGQIMGGVVEAIPTGHRDTIGALPAWQYTFRPQDARLPAIHQTASSAVTLAADLWIAPEINAVLRYEITATVRGVHLLWADRTQSTVSGTLTLQYALDVAQLDSLPNISVPHGC